MSNNGTTAFVKVFLVFVAASILTLAAFGVGVSVGVRAASPPASSRQLQPVVTVESAPLPTVTFIPTVPASIPTPATPLPTPTEEPIAPTIKPAPTAGNSTKKSGPSGLDTALFEEVWKLLQEQFYGELPESKEVTYNAIRGLVERLGDQNTAFVDPKQAALFNSDMQGQFEGIGAGVELAEGGGVRIRYLFAGQPAEKSGVQVGDVIIAVDGKDITKLNLTEAISLIRGPKDSRVVLTIRREGQQPLDITVTRARIEIPTVTTKTLGEGKIAHIALSEFSSVAPARLADAMKEALAAKPAGLILDLRGNPGGLLDSAVRIGSYFVPEGNIVIERTKDGKERIFRRQGSFLLGKTPLVVLIDAGSASASEIVAGAIQDVGSGVLIGEKTFGKGSVQVPNNLSDGSQLRVTIARWFTPKNRGIHGTGLQPDIVVPLTKEDVAAKRDPQLDRAVEYLLKGK
ncbi:MAG: S41 family peptidase [Chloroflexi bacterium]|nr:S41 family peptidase [Chloroflexota bacterium]